MPNFPDDVKEASPNAPWNVQRSQEDIEDEIAALDKLKEKIEELSIELEFHDTAGLFPASIMTNYEMGNPVDVVDSMGKVVGERIKELKQL